MAGALVEVNSQLPVCTLQQYSSDEEEEDEDMHVPAKAQ
jgi:hypothetical protein